MPLPPFAHFPAAYGPPHMNPMLAHIAATANGLYGHGGHGGPHGGHRGGPGGGGGGRGGMRGGGGMHRGFDNGNWGEEAEKYLVQQQGLVTLCFSRNPDG